MPVEMVSEVEHDSRLRLVAPIEPTQPEHRPEREEVPTSYPRRPIFPAREVMAVIEVLMKALGLRVLLACALGAVAYLGYLTVSEPSAGKIWAMGFWSVLVFLPLVFLVREKG